MSSRLFGIGLGGTAITSREREILSRHPPLGLILFRRNIQEVGAMQALIADARALGVKLLFLDEEGGPVDRLREVVAPFPSFRRVAQTGRARPAGELVGQALSRLGFDVDLAPVVDRGLEGAGALVLGERSAGTDPIGIIEAAGAFLEGLHASGVGGCLKHFPGLGRARVDTHRDLPVLPSDDEQQRLDLAPFQALWGRARAVMISHAAGPDGTPASLSRSQATDLLRARLGFDGAAFSDDLEMGALSAFGSLPQRCSQAARAGCDLLFVCSRIEEYPACVEAVEREVPPERIREASRRLEDYADHLTRIRQRAPRTQISLEALAQRVRAFGSLPPEATT